MEKILSALVVKFVTKYKCQGSVASLLHCSLHWINILEFKRQGHMAGLTNLHKKIENMTPVQCSS